MKSMQTIDRSDRNWIDDLSSDGPSRNSALEDLRKILHGGLVRAFAGRMKVRGREFEALADDFVQEALLLILKNLDGFQGKSRFTTWAYKIVIRAAFSELRRKRWKDVSLERLLEKEGLPRQMVSGAPGPESLAESSSMMQMIRRAMDEELTEKQRNALTAVVFGGMPLEVAADRMNMNRNALYKLLFDARLRLKRRLERDGLSPGDSGGGRQGKIS